MSIQNESTTEDSFCALGFNYQDNSNIKWTAQRPDPIFIESTLSRPVSVDCHSVGQNDGDWPQKISRFNAQSPMLFALPDELMAKSESSTPFDVDQRETPVRSPFNNSSRRLIRAYHTHALVVDYTPPPSSSPSLSPISDFSGTPIASSFPSVSASIAHSGAINSMDLSGFPANPLLVSSSVPCVQQRDPFNVYRPMSTPKNNKPTPPLRPSLSHYNSNTNNNAHNFSTLNEATGNFYNPSVQIPSSINNNNNNNNTSSILNTFPTIPPVANSSSLRNISATSDLSMSTSLNQHQNQFHVGAGRIDSTAPLQFNPRSKRSSLAPQNGLYLDSNEYSCENEKNVNPQDAMPFFRDAPISQQDNCMYFNNNGHNLSNEQNSFIKVSPSISEAYLPPILVTHIHNENNELQQQKKHQKQQQTLQLHMHSPLYKNEYIEQTDTSNWVFQSPISPQIDVLETKHLNQLDGKPDSFEARPTFPNALSGSESHPICSVVNVDEEMYPVEPENVILVEQEVGNGEGEVFYVCSMPPLSTVATDSALSNHFSSTKHMEVSSCDRRSSYGCSNDYNNVLDSCRSSDCRDASCDNSRNNFKSQPASRYISSGTNIPNPVSNHSASSTTLLQSIHFNQNRLMPPQSRASLLSNIEQSVSQASLPLSATASSFNLLTHNSNIHHITYSNSSSNRSSYSANVCPQLANVSVSVLTSACVHPFTSNEQLSLSNANIKTISSPSISSRSAAMPSARGGLSREDSHAVSMESNK